MKADNCRLLELLPADIKRLPILRLQKIMNAPLIITGVIPGSRVLVAEYDEYEPIVSEELIIYNEKFEGTELTLHPEFAYERDLIIRVRKGGDETSYKPLEIITYFGEEGIHLHIQQIIDPVY